jgi:tetratricopeptide (TPR) repeat protein
MSDEVIAVYREVIAFNPNLPQPHESLARALEAKGEIEESRIEYARAIEKYGELVAREPQKADTHHQFALLLLSQGSREKAREEFREFLKRQQYPAKSYNEIGWFLAANTNPKYRDGKAAIEFATKACELTNWKHPVYLYTLSAAYAENGDSDAAISWRTKVVEALRFLNPDPAELDSYNNIAWDFATHQEHTSRDGKAAVLFATKACEITTYTNTQFLDTLAAAYAESGDFDSAVKWQSKAIELLSDAKEKEDYGTRLKLYQDKKPYHMPGQ